MSSTVISSTWRRRGVYVVAAVGVALLVVLASVISITVRRRREFVAWTAATHTEFSFCGREIELRDGYVATLATPALAESAYDTIFIAPLDFTARPEALDDLVVQPGSLGGDARSLSEVIDESRRLGAEVRPARIRYSDTEFDGSCRVTTAVDSGARWPEVGPREPWVLEVNFEGGELR